ncbi:hypothetical protein D3C71_1694140 [compost metagenome]
MGGTVVSTPIGILDHMGELMLDEVHPLTQHLIHDGPRGCSEAVSRVDFGAVAHPTQSGVDRVLAHGAFARADAGKDVASVARDGVEVVQDFHRLPRQRHDVIDLHLHLCTGNAPLGRVQIDLCPLGRAQLTRPYKDQGGEL